MSLGESSFHFSCRRSGRCCRVPDGFAFVDEAELPDLARVAGLALDEFTQLYLRSVVDPRTGEPRLCLRDRPDGACALLDGDNECSVYEARPKGCRDFPVWPSILGDPKGMERAMGLCPGIERRAAGAARVAALEALGGVLGGAGRPSKCGFGRGQAWGAGGPWVTGLEFELLVEGASGEFGEPGGCPLQEGLECASPGHAPLGCRPGAGAESDFAYARDQLEAEQPWPRQYAPLGDLLERRRSSASIELHPDFTATPKTP